MRRCLSFALVLLAATGVRGEAPSIALPLWPAPNYPVDNETQKIKALIAQLGDEAFKKREQAAAELKKIGNIARGSLEVAAANVTGDPDAAARAAAILADLGPSPAPANIPKRFAELYEYCLNYPDNRNYDPEKRNAFNTPNELTYFLVERLASAHAQASERQQYREIADAYADIPATLFVADGDMPRALVALARGAGAVFGYQQPRQPTVYSPQTTANLAALLYQLNPDEKIDAATIVDRLAEKYSLPEAAAAIVAAQLCFAHGDFPGAIALAEREHDRLLLSELHWRRADWPKAADIDPDLLDSAEHGDRMLWRHVLALRFAGETDRVDIELELAQMQFTDARAPKRDEINIQLLLVNDRVEPVLEALYNRNRLVDAHALLVSLGRYREAAAAVDDARARKLPALNFLLFKQAKTLCDLGEEKKARDLFAEIKGDISDVVRSYSPDYDALAMRLGFMKEPPPTHLISCLPGIDYTVLHFWTKRFDKDAAATLEEKNRQIVRILRNQLPREEMTAALRAAAEFVRTARGTPPATRRFNLRLVLQTLHLVSRLDLAAEFVAAYVESETDPTAYRFLGDIAMEDGKFEDALALYLKAATAGRGDAALMRSAGRAAEKAGKPEGRALMDRAVLLPFGDAAARNALIAAMQKFGASGAAVTRQLELVDLLSPHVTGAPRGASTQAFTARRDSAEAAGDYRAALAAQRQLLLDITPDYACPSAAALHRLAALVALQDKNADVLYRETDAFLTVSPPDVALLSKVIPALRAAKASAQADKLLKRALNLVTPIVEDYPNYKPAADTLAALKKLAQ